MRRCYSLFLPRSAGAAAWLAILIVFAISFLSLVGWALGITLLKSIRPQWTSMRVVTVICLVLCAVELALLQKGPSSVRKLIALQAPGILVGLVGLLTIATYSTDMITGRETPRKKAKPTT